MDAPSDSTQDSQASVEGLIEALLFLGGTPLTPAQLGDVISENAPDEIVRIVAQLNQRYHRQGRPYEIRRVGAGYQMGLRPQFTSLVRRLHGHVRQVRLSQAAVEVLALVAYKQPVTPHEIDAVRGIDSAAILRQLRRRNLIESIEGGEPSDRTVRYQTTRRFLELFHLGNLDDLPRVQDALPI